MLNNPPIKPSQLPGYTAPVVNRQSIPSISSVGQPQLQTTPSGYGPIPTGFPTTFAGAPGYPVSSNLPSSSSSNVERPISSIGNQGGGNMLSSNPPNMQQYFKSKNPSTLMRTLVGNTTKSGAMQ